MLLVILIEARASEAWDTLLKTVPYMVTQKVPAATLALKCANVYVRTHAVRCAS